MASSVRSPQTSQRPPASGIIAPQVGHLRMGPAQCGQERESWGMGRSQWGHSIFLLCGDFAPRLASTQAISIATASIAAPTRISFAISETTLWRGTL